MFSASCVLLARARYTVFGGTSELPSTSVPPTGRRIVRGGGVGFSWLPEAVLNVPPSLKAQSMSLEVTELPYGMPVPPAKNATYCSPLTE